jgi:cytidine deaminase
MSDLEELVNAAKAVQKHAHAPYSRFRVGAALRTRSGKTFVGANVENASFGATVCAERSAVSAMVAAGERDIEAIAVFTDADTVTMPCGICRQVLLEFGPRCTVVAVTPSARETTTLVELLPHPFVFEKP